MTKGIRLTKAIRPYALCQLPRRCGRVVLRPSTRPQLRWRGLRFTRLHDIAVLPLLALDQPGIAAGASFLSMVLDVDTLNEEVIKHLDSTVEFYVFNTRTDQVRQIVVMPTNNWNGQGCLGA